MAKGEPERELPLIGRDIPFSAIEGELCRVVDFGNLSQVVDGKVGTKVVAKLLDRGHNVTAFIYGKSSFPSNEKSEVIKYHLCVSCFQDIQKNLK